MLPWMTPVFQEIDKARRFGFRELSNGVLLYGHTPHLAPEAWFHVIYPALATPQIDAIEKAITCSLPYQYKELLTCCNGMKLFCYSLSLSGVKRSYTRVGDDAWQPYCIISDNTDERPSRMAESQVVVASYRQDASVVVCDNDNGTVIRRKQRSPKVLNEWPSFSEFLASEVRRLSALFDDNGRPLDPRQPTTP